MADTLTDEERAQIRYHLGYPNVSAVASYQIGVPIPVQTAFLVESAMGRVIPLAIPKVREILALLDNIECRMIEGQKRLAANKVGEIEVRPEEIPQLEREHTRWAQRLADILCVPLYPFSAKFRSTGAGNISVRG